MRDSAGGQTAAPVRNPQPPHPKQSFDETKRPLVDTFQSVGSQALARNNAQFLALAEQRFDQLSAAQDEKSAAQHHTFGAMVQPIRDALSEQKAAVTQLSTHHAQAYGELNKKTELLATAHTQLSAARRITPGRGTRPSAGHGHVLAGAMVPSLASAKLLLLLPAFSRPARVELRHCRRHS